MIAPKENLALARTIKPDEANANPTKAFFISLITRDVNITDCIKDLIDNSIDGAIRNVHRQPISRFRIDLTVSPKKFEVVDNCGGIELAVARDYAFRFGRPENKVERDRTISGRYGIGMKRALFKLGNVISLETCALQSSFSLRLNVKEWQKDDSFPWVFKLDNIAKERSPLEDTLTIIKVDELHDEVAEEFDDPVNLRHLAIDLQFAYADRIRHGLQLFLNGNTAKNRINTESPVYRYVLPKLRKSLRQVADYINERKIARANGDDRFDKPLKSAKPVSLWDVPKGESFKVVVTRKSKEPTVGRISYERPIWMIEKAMETSGADSPKKLGEFTFDYYFKKNCQ